MITKRTEQERAAYIQGYEAALKTVQSHGVQFALVSLGLIKETESTLQDQRV